MTFRALLTAVLVSSNGRRATSSRAAAKCIQASSQLAIRVQRPQATVVSEEGQQSNASRPSVSVGGEAATAGARVDALAESAMVGVDATNGEDDARANPPPAGDVPVLKSVLSDELLDTLPTYADRRYGYD